MCELLQVYTKAPPSDLLAMLEPNAPHALLDSWNCRAAEGHGTEAD